MVGTNVYVVAVAPGMSANDPPGACTCHWTVGAGTPAAAAVSVTGAAGERRPSPAGERSPGGPCPRRWRTPPGRSVGPVADRERERVGRGRGAVVDVADPAGVEVGLGERGDRQPACWSAPWAGPAVTVYVSWDDVLSGSAVSRAAWPITADDPRTTVSPAFVINVGGSLTGVTKMVNVAEPGRELAVADGEGERVGRRLARRRSGSSRSRR